ncbi:MAG TPA: amidohydrolase family protein [Streptosporangiaceae bacterium]
MILSWPYRRIATEEAFSISEIHDALRRWAARADPAEPDQDFWDFAFTQDTPGLRRVRRQLLDVDSERLEIMDANGVDVHLLSLTAPGVQTFPSGEAAALARMANDRLAETIKRHPGRYAGLAAVAPQHPKAAAEEIARAITGLHLNGVIINSHTYSEYLDDQKFWPILEAAEALGAPIYLHPRSPARPMAPAFKKYGLETGIWGFQAEVGLHALRLICGGIFDRFPRLRIVLGHLGEGLPYWLYRLDYMHPVRASYHTRPGLSLKPSEYIKQNFAITTSGMNWAPVLRFCIEAVGADNIMFAIGYPYQTTEAAVSFLDQAEISDEDRRKIYHRNAERIFGIPSCESPVAGDTVAGGTA